MHRSITITSGRPLSRNGKSRLCNQRFTIVYLSSMSATAPLRIKRVDDRSSLVGHNRLPV